MEPPLGVFKAFQQELKAADEAANTFIIGAKKVIGFSLGDAWSPAWAEAGFLHDNLRTPTKTVDRIALLDRLAIYLASHPESQGKTQKIIATFKPLSTNLPQEQAAKPLVDFRPGVADGLLWTLIAAPLYQAG